MAIFKVGDKVRLIPNLREGKVIRVSKDGEEIEIQFPDGQTVTTCWIEDYEEVPPIQVIKRKRRKNRR